MFSEEQLSALRKAIADKANEPARVIVTNPPEKVEPVDFTEVSKALDKISKSVSTKPLEKAVSSIPKVPIGDLIPVLQRLCESVEAVKTVELDGLIQSINKNTDEMARLCKIMSKSKYLIFDEDDKIIGVE